MVGVGGWSKAPARALHIYPVAAAIGVATYLIVYGPGHLFGTDAYWQMPQADERMALIGYRYFLHEPWHWPVFVSRAINVPYPTSVAFSDCIPLWALVNKAIATLVPPWRSFSSHAYLGLWHGLVYALQACFGVAILRALGHRSWREGIVTTLFFLAVTAWIFRYGHPALSAHWIELWAIYLYVRAPAMRRLGVAWCAQLTVAALLSPYHPAMSIPIFVASLVRSRDARTIATWLPVGLTCVALATWFAGYFAHEATVAQWGFEQESTNVLSWLVPMRSGIIGDARWIANIMATDWQYEGFAYLGLGWLGLLALFMPHIKTLRGVIRRHGWLFAAALGCWLFALSDHIYFGSHELASYSIPSFLHWIPDQFRSPGRFVWVPMYVVMVFLLHWSFTTFSNGRRFAILVAAAAIQLVDARGEWAVQRASTDGPQSVLLDRQAWRALIHAHERVFVYPTYTCIDDERMFQLNEVSTTIQLLASERGLPINGTYNTRARRKCTGERQLWPSLELQPDALYVLLPQATAIADRFEAGGASCGVFDYGRVCSTNAAAIADAIRARILRPPPAPISLGVGQRLEVGATPLDAGWSHAEAGGRWTDGAIASLLLHLDRTAPPFGGADGRAQVPVVAGDPPATLGLQVMARLCGARRDQDVDVLIDGTKLTTLHFDAGSNDAAKVRTIAIPDRTRLRRTAIALQLVPRDTRSPAALGCDADMRKLGVWVSRLWFE